jgi:uncharacterized repeat protein (TIGR01451 family)
MIGGPPDTEVIADMDSFGANRFIQGGIPRVEISAARGERRGAGLLALVTIGILFATLLLGARVSPTRAVADQATCERPLDVVLIIDRSGSMGTSQGAHTRLGWAKIAATNFVDALNGHGGVNGSGLHQVGLTSYGGASATVNHSMGSSDATTLDGAINGLAANGVTPLKQGMAAGAGDMAAHDRDQVDGVAVTHVLILLSDGRPNPDATGAAGSRPDATEISGYLSAADQTFGIGIGAGGTGANNPDLTLMNALSKPAGSPSPNFYHVTDAGSLPDLFSAIAEELLCGNIQIEKTPDPAGPVDPGTSVTYTYDVTNDGDTPLANVEVTDDTCSPVTGPTKSGGNSDQFLDKGETWTYHCTMPLQQTTKNEACADGDFIGGGHDSACADVTVEVNPPAPDVPSIDIRKSSDAKGTVEPGTLVTYTYEVQNTGETPLANVKVTDLISDSDAVACEVDSSSYTGDDGNGILDIGETWTFSCSTSLKVTTSNEACVVADVAARQDVKVAEQQVEACDDVKVEVSASPQQSVEAGTGTPAATQPNTALNAPGGGVLPTILFSFILIGTLGTLAYTNVRVLRRRG